MAMPGWSKGVAFVNGINLGWYWPTVGPQMTLYIPGAFLRDGENELVLLEVEESPKKPSGEPWHRVSLNSSNTARNCRPSVTAGYNISRAWAFKLMTASLVMILQLGRTNKQLCLSASDSGNIYSLSIQSIT